MKYRINIAKYIYDPYSKSYKTLMRGMLKQILNKWRYISFS
jgi:hypothetical protein